MVTIKVVEITYKIVLPTEQASWTTRLNHEAPPCFVPLIQHYRERPHGNLSPASTAVIISN